MDPYLEDPAFWSDFHRRFINYVSEFVADRLPAAYEARIDEKIRVVMPDQPDSRYFPDVGVTHGPTVSDGGQEAGGVATATAIALEPVVMTPMEEVRDIWLEILHRPHRDLVTVIEVLSPSNKVEPGLRAYTARRDEFLHQNVNFVEINLLVGGLRPPISSPWLPSDYYALIARGPEHPRASLVRWNVRDRLPTIPTPLLAPDPDVLLDLQAVFTQTYDRGRYAPSLNYVALPVAPLAAADREWAAGIARAPR
jgi:hypothetical protein